MTKILALKRVLFLSPALLLMGLLVLPTTASAHERRMIDDGKYQVVVGWDTEPAFTGLKNGASVRISTTGSDSPTPVEGADKTLKVRIQAGDQMQEFPLRAVFGQQGYYLADIIPTRAGDYQWTFVGTLNGDQINETFDTADGKFDAVDSASEIMFPAAPGSDMGAGSSSTMGSSMSDHGDMSQP